MTARSPRWGLDSVRSRLSGDESRPLRFLVSGGFSATAEYGSFALLSLAHLPVTSAQPISFTIGLTVSYFMNKMWVFGGGQSVHKQHHQLLMFVSLGIFNAVLTTYLMHLAVNDLGINRLVAKLAMMLGVATWNYVIMHKVVFRKHPQKG